MTPTAAADQVARQRTEATPHPGGRPDIQGLRALAVLLVLVYHLRPDWVPGGFLGVDVFFVISGFLIIGTLGREGRRSGTVALGSFYAKRVRRLIPAATIVLVSIVVATMVLLPAAAWSDVMREVVASALNVQNILLAIVSTEYAHATASASPVQHFWSLAVEEQFYLVTPLLVLLAARFGGRDERSRGRAILATVAAVTLASFVFSVWFTPDHHTAAYFLTPTRMWQLGIGGLVALGLSGRRPSARVGAVLGWVAFATIIVCAFTYSTEMDFPGWVAIVPTLASATLLAVGPVEPEGYRTINAALGHQPWRYIGDISYSLYLWHWPLIVFAMALSPTGTVRLRYVPVVAGLSLLLAALSKRWVEDPFRTGGLRSVREGLGHPGVSGLLASVHHALPQTAHARTRRALAAGALAISTTCLVALPAWAWSAHVSAGLEAQLRESGGLDAEHPGAQANGGKPPAASALSPGVSLLPDPSVALQDVSEGFRAGCDSYDVTKKPLSDPSCWYGDAHAPKTMVLVGDSHAGQYSTALIALVKAHPQWRLKIANSNGCPFSLEPPRSGGRPFLNCLERSKAKLAAVLALKPDLVVTASMSPLSYNEDLHWTWPSYATAVEGEATVMRALRDADIGVVAMRSLPRPERNVPRCLMAAGDDPATCDTSRSTALVRDNDPVGDAGAAVPGVTVLDLAPTLCTSATCPAVMGNVVVYRDNHLSNTFVRSLMPWFDARLRLG